MTAKARRRRRNGARSAPDNAPPRFIGYVRVSTHDQADNGVSMTAQRDRLEAWAKAHEYELVRIARVLEYLRGQQNLLDMSYTGSVHFKTHSPRMGYIIK